MEFTRSVNPEYISHADVNDEVKDFFRSTRKKVLYGAGCQGRACWDLVRSFGFDVEYFIAQKPRNSLISRGMPVKNIDSIPDEDKETCDVLISVNEKFNDEIKELLEKKGFRHIYWSNNWNRSNEQLRLLFLEGYLKGRLETFSISDDLIQFNNFKIVGCNNQPVAYRSMLIGDFHDIIAPSIFGDYSCITEGAYEWGNIQIEKDDIVLDLGANIGAFSCVAASKGGQVYAFEPTPSTIELLKMNQALYKRFTIVPCAVCNQTGKANFYCNSKPDPAGQMDIGVNSLLDRFGYESIEVNTITIDAFVEQEKLEKVDFIKADIEGGEREMLKGARDTLARFAPKLALCTYHLPGDKEVMEQLILEANPDYVIEHKWGKLYAYVPRDKVQH